MKTHLRLSLVIGSLTACQAVGGADWRALDTVTNRPVELTDMADALAELDVVFLGEQHDNDVGHELQLRLTELLIERRGDVVVSMEMFERDAQHLLDLYLRGAVDEAYFLAHGRPWGNYVEHYRPVVELARAHGLPVVAANCYRALASRVSREGRWSVAGDPWAAAAVDTGEGRYRDKFFALMEGHAGEANATMRRFFAAQCLKDDTMAESIARVLAVPGRDWSQQPLVVHWCGAFHSDEWLGTVERLQRRVPGVRVGVVTMVPTGRRKRALTEDERGLADYVWLVPPAE